MAPGGIDFQLIKKWAGGILFVGSLFFTALNGFILLSVIYVPCFLLGVSFAQWLYDTLMSFWFAFAVAAYELFYGVKVVIRGDVHKMNKNRSVLIIMNHRTRLDWMFFFSIQLRFASLRNFKIALKNELRHIPGAGWAMQTAHFLFLKRKWDKDKENIEDILKLFRKNGTSPQLLFFPEGTDFQRLSRQKSREYAEKNELDDYNYVLHPRTLGFTSVVNYMREYNALDQIIDVTVAYPKTILQRETDLVTGNIPREVVFTVKTYDIGEIPVDNEPQMIRWIEDCWKDKEDFLRIFYRNEFQHYDKCNGYTADQNTEIERDIKLYMIGAVIFWCILMFVTGYLFYNYYLFRWLYFVYAMLSIIGSSFYGLGEIFSQLSNVFVY